MNVLKSKETGFKAKINECCVLWPKVVSLAITRGPIISPKHMIAVKRHN